MKKFLLVLFLMSGILYSGSWENQVKDELNNKDGVNYERIIEILDLQGKVEEAAERKFKNVLYAFSFFKLGDQKKENFYIKEYYENDCEMKEKLKGIKTSSLIEIENFIEGWEMRFPKILQCRLVKTEYDFNAEPESIEVELELSNDSKYELINFDKRDRGSFIKGVNNIKLFEGKTLLKLIMEDLLIEKIIEIKKDLFIPENIEIIDGNVEFKDKKKKEEYEVVKIVGSRINFDKKLFMQKGVLPGGIGLGAFLINRGFLSGKKNEDPFMRGLSFSMDLVSVGLIIKGISGYFKARSKEKFERLEKKKIDGAENYNRYLARLLEKEKENIEYRYSLNMENVK